MFVRAALGFAVWVGLFGCSSDAKPAPAPTSAPVGVVPPPPPIDAAVPLRLIGVDPPDGIIQGRAVVLVRGEGFIQVERAVKVYVGGKAARVLQIVSDEGILVETPEGTPGEVADLRVVFEPGGELTVPRAFTFAATPADEPPPSAVLQVEAAEREGDERGLSAAEIDQVVKSRTGLLRACYQRELPRDPELRGKLVVSFTIAADGTVAAPRIDDARSTLADPAVRSCVQQQFVRLRFPAKGGATVTYPLIFAPG